MQTTVCETGSRMYCMTWGIEPIFYSGCKWKVTFKNCIKIKQLKKKKKETSTFKV